MGLPIVAIVGRPNVGKSSLFNALAGRRIAIVDPTAGVTRDRISATISVDDRYFDLIDTGGMGIQDSDNLTDHVEEQIRTALDDAQLILFVVDVRAGRTSLDEEVAEKLRTVNKPVLCVVNKCDAPWMDPQAAEFYKLGYKELVCVSAEQKRGMPELLKQIAKDLPEPTGDEVEPNVSLKLAIVGRRNTGKSTFINSLANSDRMIVSEVAGTTRDSVDVRFERDGKEIIAIDTAGVRRKQSVKSDIEFYSMARAERSIRRADIVLHFLDPRVRISKVDKQLTAYILEHHKPAIFVVNKWDLMVQKMPTGKFGNYIHATFPMLDFVPIAFITAKSGKNVQVLLNLAQNLHKQAGARVETALLNKVLREAIELQAPPLRQNRRPKIFYGTQAATHPPTVVLFTNGPDLFDNTYQRYLLKVFHDNLPFADVPIKLHLRHKKGADADTPPDGVELPQPKAKVREEEDWLAETHNETEQSIPKPAPKRQTGKPELWKDV